MGTQRRQTLRGPDQADDRAATGTIGPVSVPAAPRLHPAGDADASPVSDRYDDVAPVWPGRDHGRHDSLLRNPRPFLELPCRGLRGCRGQLPPAIPALHTRRAAGAVPADIEDVALRPGSLAARSSGNRLPEEYPQRQRAAADPDELAGADSTSAGSAGTNASDRRTAHRLPAGRGGRIGSARAAAAIARSEIAVRRPDRWRSYADRCGEPGPGVAGRPGTP